MKKGMVAILSGMIGAATVGAAAIFFRKENKGSKEFKFKSYYNVVNQWLILRQEGKTLEKYFMDRDYKTIAIYGMGELGNRLYEELRSTNIEVKYAIDKNAAGVFSELAIFDLDDELEKVDVIVVTTVFAYDSILKELEDRIEGVIISLEDVVFEV